MKPLLAPIIATIFLFAAVTGKAQDRPCFLEELFRGISLFDNGKFESARIQFASVADSCLSDDRAEQQRQKKLLRDWVQKAQNNHILSPSYCPSYDRNFLDAFKLMLTFSRDKATELDATFERVRNRLLYVKDCPPPGTPKPPQRIQLAIDDEVQTWLDIARREKERILKQVVNEKEADRLSLLAENVLDEIEFARESGKPYPPRLDSTNAILAFAGKAIREDTLRAPSDEVNENFNDAAVNFFSKFDERFSAQIQLVKDLAGRNGLFFELDKGQAYFLKYDENNELESELLYQHRDYISSVTFEDSLDMLVSSSYDSTHILISFDAHRQFMELDGHRKATTFSYISASRQRILTGSTDSTAIVYDFNGNTRQTITGVNGFIYDGAISDSGFIFLRTSEPIVRVWDLQGSEKSDRKIVHQDYVRSAVLSPKGDYLLTGSLDGTATLLHFTSASSISVNHGEPILEALFSPSGNYFLTRSKYTVRIWDLKGEMRGVIQHENTINKAKFDGADQYAITCSGDKTARITDWKRDTILQTFPHEDSGILELNASQTGNYLITTSAEGIVKLWKRGNPSAVLKINLLAGPKAPDLRPEVTVIPAFFSADGTYVILLERNNTRFRIFPNPDVAFHKLATEIKFSNELIEDLTKQYKYDFSNLWKKN